MRKGSIVYSEELAKEICDVIAETHHGLKYLCDRNPTWPHARTVRQWIDTNPSFKAMYSRAKEHQMEILMTETLDIAYDDSKDLIEQTDGKVMTNPGAINRARLKIEIINRQAAKLAPKTWADDKNKQSNNNDFLSANRDEINSSDE